MAKRSLRILHLSDLHIGKELPQNAWRFARVMGDVWKRNLDEIRADGPIDLVCFTGDLAQSGKPEQYEEAARLIEAVLESVECPKQRFFSVPGNHDVDRKVAPEAWEKLRSAQWHSPRSISDWMAGGQAPFGCDAAWREEVLSRQQAYRNFLAALDLHHLLPGEAGNPHPTLGYRRTLDLGLGAPLHIIGFDSAWLAGDDNDASKLRLTDDQIGRLMHGPDGALLDGWSIGLIHHPITDLADGRAAQLRLGEFGLGMLLHGHQHEPVIEHRSDPHAGLHVFAAGCLYEHERYPNGLLVVDVDLPHKAPVRPRQVWARAWSDRRAEWRDDPDLYRGATTGGRLRLIPDVPAHPTPTPGRLIGRSTERGQLRDALLPAAHEETLSPVAICCVIDGMPGVGKTRLAEEFVADDWREALALPRGASMQNYCARLALAPDDGRDADALAASVLAAYQRNAMPGQSSSVLRELLLSGPGGRRLLLIENVDGPAQAAAVASLAASLPGCAVLATARYRDLAGGHWRPVPVDPLPQAQAVELLRNRVKAGRKPYRLSDEDANTLARRLGGLPLALHIAGSHLGRGLSPQRFVEQLQAQQLALGPAAAGDVARDADAARGVIASAFRISWDLWCATADTARQQALIALAHGPAEGVGDALGAAIAALAPDEYELCTLDADSLSLLDVDLGEHADTAARRVRMHPLIAEFLRLQPVPDEATVMVRIGGWCDPLLQEDGADAMPAAWATLRAETPAVLHWLARVPQPPSAAAIGRGMPFVLSHGPYPDWLRAVARWAGRGPDQAVSGSLRLAESHLSQWVGDMPRSEAAAQAALTLFQRAGRERDVAITQGKIADILQSRGDLEEALRIRREEQLPVFERLGDVHALLIGRTNLAITLAQRGRLEDVEEIRTLLHQALTDAERLRLPEAETIRGLIAGIFGVEGEAVSTPEAS